MNGRNLIIAAIAVALGLIAVVLANAWFSGIEDKQQAALTDNSITRIVVAAQPLEFGAKLTPQNLKMQDWPKASVPAGAFTNLQQVLSDKGKERFALRPIVPGEPILTDRVSPGRATLAANLPEGMRAYPMPVDALRGVAGFVLPGSMVDIILTRKIAGEGATDEDLRADVILSNVQVLAVDQLADEKTGKPKVGKTATLAVSLFDAQRLSMAVKMGTLSLALRKVEAPLGTDANGTPIPTEFAATVTGRQVGGPRLYVAKRGGGGGNAAPAPNFMPQAAPPRAAQGFVAAPPSGPTMTVFRGAEPTVYPVGHSGGR